MYDILHIKSIIQTLSLNYFNIQLVFVGARVVMLMEFS